MMPQPWQEFAGELAGGRETKLSFTVYPGGTAAFKSQVPEGETARLVLVLLDAATARDFAERLTRSLQYAGNGPFGPGRDWKPHPEADFYGRTHGPIGGGLE